MWMRSRGAVVETLTKSTVNRILVIDAARSIHDEFRRILERSPVGAGEIQGKAAALFDRSTTGAEFTAFRLDSAYRGEEGVQMVRRACESGRPYAMAFVDVGMPPDCEGIETITRIWDEFPDLQVVLCTPCSDSCREEQIDRLQHPENLLILKRPFNDVEVRQLACAMAEKSRLVRQSQLRLEELQATVSARLSELEAKKQELNDALSHLGEAELQLLQSEKMASIGQLAAGVAHEINNPIGFISSNLNTLREYADGMLRMIEAYRGVVSACECGGGDVAASISHVRETEKAIDFSYLAQDMGTLITESIDGAKRVRRIVADLRDFSHADSPAVANENVNELIEKTINVAWNEIKYKAEVVRQYGSIPTLPCYGGKLRQVFLNLLVNAAHAIGNRGVITVRTGEEDDHIWIEIEDDGCGIPPENFKRIFDPFFTTKEVGKGTGLGLHLARTIVEAHGGTIQARGGADGGALFRIRIPVSGPPSENREEAGHE